MIYLGDKKISSGSICKSGMISEEGVTLSAPINWLKIYCESGRNTQTAMDWLSNIIRLDFHGINKISAYAFRMANSLESLDFTDVTEIGTAAFSYITNTLVTEIYLPDIVTIGTSAFQNSNKFEQIVLGENINTIGNYAFGYMNRLNSISIYSTSVPVATNKNIVQSVPTTCVFHVKQGTIPAYASATNWSAIVSVAQGGTGNYTFIDDL